jgi:hypothetical protein
LSNDLDLDRAAVACRKIPQVHFSEESC